jgi:hypothetical protein
MSAVLSLEASISEPLTWGEIRERYPDQWVCLVEMARIEEHDFEFRTARVVGHGKTPREPLDQARPLRERYTEIGHYYTGRLVGPSLRIFA